MSIFLRFCDLLAQKLLVERWWNVMKLALEWKQKKILWNYREDVRIEDDVVWIESDFVDQYVERSLTDFDFPILVRSLESITS